MGETVALWGIDSAVLDKLTRWIRGIHDTTTWEVKCITIHAPSLGAGWEPFAADGGNVYWRRRVKGK